MTLRGSNKPGRAAVQRFVRLDGLWRDIRLAFRGFQRAPAAAAGVVATLAVALGLNATAFSVFNAYVIRPAGVRDADSLYTFTWLNREHRPHRFSWDEYQQLRRDTTSLLTGVMAVETLLTRLNAQTIRGELVTGNYFATLGVHAALGRMLTPADAAAPGREAVVVLSDMSWERLFDRDPAIVGREINFRGTRVEVVGVAPAGFVGLGMVPQDFWAPVTLSPLLAEGPDLFGAGQPQRLEVTVYLRPEHGPESAAAALVTWARQITADRPEPARAVTPLLVPAATAIPFSFDVLLAFAPVAGAFGLVLLTASANIAGLMLSRALSRQREIGVRLSLGATRAMIVRQFLTEAALLALAASGVGFVLARVLLDWGIRVVFATLPAAFVDFVRLVPLLPDFRVFVWMLIAAVLAAVVFGVVPALHTTRGAMAMKAQGSSTPDAASSRLRHGLVVAQITVSALLIVTCGVLLRGAARLADADLGFRTRDIVQIRTPARSVPTVVATLASSPLVRGFSATSHMTFGNGWTIRVAPLDATDIPEQRIERRFASPEFFAVLDIPLVSGRTFTDAEGRSGGPVVILSRTAADRLWPKQNPVGRTLRMALDPRARVTGPAIRYPIAEVIGVVGDMATSFETTNRALIYMPTWTGAPDNLMLVRTAGDQDEALRQLEASLTAADVRSVDQIFTLDDLASGRVFPFRAAYWLAAIIGALALLLTTSGIHGVLSYAVSRRTREIGIRMALGATAGRVTGEFLAHSLRLCAVGLAIGTVFALGASKLLSAELVMVPAFDAVAFTAGTVIVLAVCMAAGVTPARRAARTDPIVALRVD